MLYTVTPSNLAYTCVFNEVCVSVYLIKNYHLSLLSLFRIFSVRVKNKFIEELHSKIEAIEKCEVNIDLVYRISKYCEKNPQACFEKSAKILGW